MSDEEPPRFRDGRSGISIDRVLIRWVNITQIVLAFLAIFGTVLGGMWGVTKLLDKLDKVETAVKQVPILQKQISALERMVVHGRISRTRERDDDRDESQ